MKLVLNAVTTGAHILKGKVRAVGRIGVLADPTRATRTHRTTRTTHITHHAPRTAHHTPHTTHHTLPENADVARAAL